MIYITRPVAETHKVIPKNIEASSEKRYLDNDVERERKFANQANKYREKELSTEVINQAVHDANSMIYVENNRFRFEIHERTKRIMVKLVDNDTDEVIREIPPEKLLDIVASIWDLVGILVDERG